MLFAATRTGSGRHNPRSFFSPMSSPSCEAAATLARPERFPVAAMLAMAVGGFGIGTGEFVIMGLLPEVAKGLQVNIAQAGRAISASAATIRAQ